MYSWDPAIIQGMTVIVYLCAMVQNMGPGYTLAIDSISLSGRFLGLSKTDSAIAEIGPPIIFAGSERSSAVNCDCVTPIS